MQQLSGKIALVTGAGRGIGKEIARQLASEGATVIINYAGNQAAAEETKKLILGEGGKADLYQCDVADNDDVVAMIDAIMSKYGRIDILVNNAGVTKDGLLMRMSEDDYDRVLDTNLKGAFHCIRHTARLMLKQKYGRIINMSSVVGLHGNPGQANYAASKAGLIGLTKSAAKELASRGITVNAVAPGYVDTDMTKVLPDSVKEKILEQIPLKCMGQVEDIANMVLFLASDQGRYITGQVISVDGGMSI